jgi:membrane protease YdiL (CAAX protease family)
LPADLTQLVFLSGIVCLIIAPHLRWWPVDSLNATPGSLALASLLDSQTQSNWQHFLVVARLPLVLGYAGGIIVCLWRSKHTVRRVLLYVLALTILALVAVSWRYLSYYSHFSYLLDRRSQFISAFDSARLSLWNLGPGLQLSAAGIVLVLLYLSRIAFNVGSLPLTLANGVRSNDDDSAWTKTRLLILLSLIPASTLIYFAVFGAARGLQNLSSHIFMGEKSAWPLWVATIISGFAPPLIAIQLFGAAGWRLVGRSLGRCRLKFLGLSVLIAPGIEVVMRFGKYVFDYIYWGAHGYGHFPPPQFVTYFEVPVHSVWYLVPLALPALVEEISFRALLQPQLVKAYGVWRGLFFVGIVWSAFHFYSDFNPEFAITDVLWGVGRRVILCLALGLVLGWLALRSGSIWPSTIAHLSYNALVYSSYRYEYAGRSLARIALWALLAYILFRYWPARTVIPANENLDLPSDAMEIGPA